MNYSRVRALGLGFVLWATGCGFATSHAVPTTIMLQPLEVASKVARHYESDGLICAFNPGGTGPRIPPAGGALHAQAVVGWEFFADYGTEPFPCREARRHDYIAAIYFDLSRVISEGGVVERAVLRFRRSDTEQPIDVPPRGEDACTLYLLAPLSVWTGGYYVGDESDPEANPPASLLYGGRPRAPLTFRNSADPADAAQAIDVTSFISSTVLRRGEGYHGILLSPRSDPSSRPQYLTGGDFLGARPTYGSCTGLFSDFVLEVTLTRVE